MANIAELYSMNIGVATTAAIVYATPVAASQSTFFGNTALAPDFVDTTIIIVAASYGDAVSASINFTIRTVFEIHAVHTHHFSTAFTPYHFLTVQAVNPIAHAASVGQEVVRAFIFTLITVSFHTIVASACLYPVRCASICIQHLITHVVCKIAITFHASTFST